MKRLLSTAAILAASTSLTMAGGIERSDQSVGFLFEDGNYLETAIANVRPKVSGTLDGPFGPLPAGSASGDVIDNHTSLSFKYKNELTPGLHLGIVLDNSVGADVTYPAGQPYPFQGASATVDGKALTALLRYELQNNVSVYGGLRYEEVSGEVSDLPTTTPGVFYNMQTSTEGDLGYVVGVAYEKPDIALRVALTYNSAIDHDFGEVTENGNPSLPFTTTIPESLNLEFQSGVATDTLVFGSVKYRKWSEFDISPAGFAAATGGASLVDLNDNVTTYSLGLGRKFSDQFSGAVTLGYEKSNGGFQGNLSATNGYKSIAIGGTYQITPDVKLSGGVRYFDIGTANTVLPGGVTTTFADNSAIAVGMRIGYSF